MGIALLGSMMLFGCRKIGETAPETASAGTSYVSEETAVESKTETKATEPPAPTEDPAPEPLVPEAIEPTPAEDALPEGMVKSYLTGEPVAEVQGRRRPVAVMLSNIISACPQSGISRAGVIYEAPVEGGITRLMGLFENYDDLEKIGSVRSCREYYVYLAAGFDALYYHYGQAAYAIPLLESDHIDNVNGMEYSEQVYYRTSDRPSPHNAYLDAAGIAAGIVSAATGHLTKTVMTDFSSLHPRQNRKRWNRDEMPPMWHRADISTTIRGFRTMRRAARICVISSGNRRSMR